MALVVNFSSTAIMYLYHNLQLLWVYIFSVAASFDPKFAHNDLTSVAIPVDISKFYNSRAFAAGPNDANMDGSGSKKFSQWCK